jgi:ECF transporter S component (folate family)
MSKVKKLVLSSLLIAALIILRQIVPLLSLSNMRISFAFIPMMLSAILMGPAWSAAVCTIGDVIGSLLFPRGGAFFLGYTLSDCLTGLIYGFFLYNTKNNRQFLFRLITGRFIVLVFINLGLNSLWLYITLKSAAPVLQTARLISNTVMFPVEAGAMFFIKQFLDAPIKKFLYETADTADDKMEVQ